MNPTTQTPSEVSEHVPQPSQKAWKPRKARQQAEGPSEASETTSDTPKRAPRARSAQGEPVKAPTGKPKATAKICELRRKLEALAAQGVNGEKIAAQRKLDRLCRRVDFSGPDLSTPDIFAGVFTTCAEASPVATFMPDDYDIAGAVKWAIEEAAHVPCLYRGGQLCAKAEPASAQRLQSIADTITKAFCQLWSQYRATPGANPADRATFVLGLSEGMMKEERRNEALPTRASDRTARKVRAKARALAVAPGIALHPYAVAANLGKQIRFCVPLDTVAGELERTIKGELAP